MFPSFGLHVNETPYYRVQTALRCYRGRQRPRGGTTQVEKEERKLPAVLDEILESFYAKLAGSGSVNEAAIRELRALFESGQKLKADDFVAVLEKAAEKGQP
jgi:hypothetical protein